MPLLYFAYGSNMLTERLQARVPSAHPVGTATLRGHALRFRKQSMDGSAKCTVVSTSPSSSSRWPSPVVGVCFQMNDAHLPALDAAEGRGQGYTREKLDVDREGSCIPAFAYVAQNSHVNPDLHPYAWYKALVMAGARQHDLPAAYLDRIRTVDAVRDPDKDRRERNFALLREAGFPPWVQHLRAGKVD